MDRRHYWLIATAIFYLVLFSVYFFVIPFIAANFPSARQSLSYIPLFFFFPFFWGFGGGRRRVPVPDQGHKDTQNTAESTISDTYSGVQDQYDPEAYYRRESRWRIIGIVALLVVFLLLATLIFLLLS